jgi:hypothetical protein
MAYSHTNTGLKAYFRVVASRNASTTMVLWIQRVMLATMQAELALWPAKPTRAQHYWNCDLSIPRSQRFSHGPLSSATVPPPAAAARMVMPTGVAVPSAARSS